jgi:Cytochrome c oxidase subunit III
MAGAHAKPNHDYHLVDPSPWPIAGAAAAFVLAAGGILWTKHISFGGLKPGSYIFGVGLVGVLYVMFSWWSDVIKEAPGSGLSSIRACFPALLTNIQGPNSPAGYGRPKGSKLSTRALPAA